MGNADVHVFFAPLDCSIRQKIYIQIQGLSYPYTSKSFVFFSFVFGREKQIVPTNFLKETVNSNRQI